MTINNWPGLSVPYSAILLNDKLKKENAKIYKNIITSLFFCENISFNKKKLKKTKKNIF